MGGGEEGNLPICDINLHLGLECGGRDGCQILNSMISVLAEVQKQLDLYPEPLRAKIEELKLWIYP